jgi:thioredoxin reductase
MEMLRQGLVISPSFPSRFCEKFNLNHSNEMKTNSDLYDVIIVGGSYAGLSAAMALGRSKRKVLIVDAGNPCNAQTPHSHNFLTQDGQTPYAIAASAKEQVLKYPTIVYRRDLASSASKKSDGFEIRTDSGENFSTRKLLLATGIKDTMPGIEGFKACWGISVLHCPYCHGYEIRDKHIGILANGDFAFEFVKTIRHWSKDLVLLTNGSSTLSPEQTRVINDLGVVIIDAPVKAIKHQQGQMSHVILEHDRNFPLSAVFSKVPFTHHTEIAGQLGCEFTDMNLIKTDDFGSTSVDGVYAAGDCSIQYRSVSIAVASGTKAGIGINKALIESEYAV